MKPSRSAWFDDLCDALRETFEPRGFSVYVSTNTSSITLTEKGYVGGGEHGVSVMVRTIPRAADSQEGAADSQERPSG